MYIYLLIVASLACLNLSTADQNSDKLLKNVAFYLERQLELHDYFDIESDEIRDGVTQLFLEHGFDDSDLLEDGILSGLWNMLFSGNGGKPTFQAYNLAFQISCYQGSSGSFWENIFYSWKKYQEYGCHCGAGISHGTPLDATDGCCKKHDECFAKVKRDYNMTNNCQAFSTQYTTTCCKASNTTKCGDGGPSAGRSLCKCDQKLAKCAAAVKCTYNVKFKNARRGAKCRVAGKRTTSIRLFSALNSCSNFRRAKNPPKTKGGKRPCPVPNKRRRRFW